MVQAVGHGTSRGIEMNKQQYLDLLMLLSALESWAMAQKETLPGYLHDRICEAVTLLSSEVLTGQALPPCSCEKGNN